MYNFNFSCFGAGKWKTELLDFAKDQLQKFPQELKVLWDDLVPNIAHDLDVPENKHNIQWSKQLFSSLVVDVLENKGPKMAVCGWGDWISCTKHWDPKFHRRQFIFVLWGLHSGLFTGSALRKSLALKPLKPALDACGVGGSKKVKEKTEAQLRSLGKNSVHSCARLYLEGWALQKEIRALFYLALPLHEGYQDMRSNMNSVEKILSYYKSMASVAALGPLKKVFETLKSNVMLGKLRFITCNSDIPLIGFDASHQATILEDESEAASSLMYTAACVLGCRLRSLLWNLEGLPGQLASLLNEQDHDAQSHRDWLKSLSDCFEAARREGDTHPTVAKQISQSFVEGPMPSHALEMLKSVNFKSTPPQLLDGISGIFSMGQTIVNEQANRTARRAETEANENKSLGAIKLLMAPYRSGVLSKVNNFDELNHDEHTVSCKVGAKSSKVTKETFAPQTKDVRLPLKKICSSSSSTSWESTTPTLAARSYAHIAWWRQCVKAGGGWGNGD